jgi:transcription termination/antitermination protein NusG
MMALDKRLLSDVEAVGPTDRQTARLDAAAAANRARLSRRGQALAAAAGDSGVEPVWHAISVRTGSEFAVDKVLGELQFDRWLASEKVRVRARKKGGTTEVLRPVFKGYVFARMAWCPSVCHWLMDVDGVLGMVGGWVAPCRVADADLVEAKAFFDLTPAERKKLAATKIRARYGLEVGDEVRLTNGPMAGLLGVIVEEIDVVSMWVEIMLFGRASRARVDLANLEKSE